MSNESQHVRTAFVLMPFNDELDRIFEQLIQPALEDAEFEVARADTLLHQQNILRDVIGGIATADLVVADLTTLNANVMYELGVAHGLRVATILIAQTLDDVPFDLRSYRIITYSDRFDEALKLRDTLTEIARRHAAREITFGSPVDDFLTTTSAPELTQAPDRKSDSIAGNVEDEAVEGGLFDFLVEGEEASDRMNNLLALMSEAIEKLGETISERGERITALAQHAGPGAAKQVLAELTRAAGDMTDFSDSVDGRLPELEEAIEAVVDNFSNYAAALRVESEETLAKAVNERDTYRSLARTTHEGLDAMNEFKETVIALPSVSRDINKAKNRLESTLSRVITAFERVEAFAARVAGVLDAEIERWIEQQAQ